MHCGRYFGPDISTPTVRRMPSFFMRASRVLGLMSSSRAAPCGAAHAPAGALQSRQNVVALLLLQRFEGRGPVAAAGRRQCQRRGGKARKLQKRPLAHNDGLLQHVLQLADIAGPGVGLQGGQIGGADLADGLAQALLRPA